MKKIVALFKNIRPIKLITVFVAGMILFITQACSSVAATTPRQTVGEQSAPPNSETYVPKGANANSGYQGGMNNFSDVDPRTDEGKFKAKAEALKENAEQNIQNSSSDPAENIRRVGEDTGKVGRNIQKETGKITEKLQNEAENFAEGTKRGIENIKENATDAAQGTGKTVQRSAENTKISAQRAAEDAGNAVDKKLTDAKSTADDKTQEAAQNTGNILEKAGKAIQDAVN